MKNAEEKVVAEGLDRIIGYVNVLVQLHTKFLFGVFKRETNGPRIFIFIRISLLKNRIAFSDL